MHKLERILVLIDDANDWVGKIVSFLTLAMIAVLMWEIALRYVFNRPTIWAHELSTMMFGAYLLLAGGYVLCHRAHVNMDIL